MPQNHIEKICLMSNTKVEDSLFYTKEHEWAKKEKKIYKIGITDYAQNALGDIVYLDINAKKDNSLKKGDVFGVVESIKSVGELCAPISGKVQDINFQLLNNPEKINKDAYASWIIAIVPEENESSEIKSIMNAKAYRKYISNLS